MCSGPHVSGSAPSRLVLEVEVAERLTAPVADDKAGVVVFLDDPRRREAARGHGGRRPNGGIWGRKKLLASASVPPLQNHASDR